jgi:predicted nucleotidyltransferase
MDDIKERLGDYRYKYFYNLQKYLDTDLYFYGSIKRYDYFKNASDVDVTIITDNVDSTLSKLKNYLHVKKSKVQKVFHKFLKSSKSLVVGYKITYEDKEHNLFFDILIYDEKYRNVIIDNVNSINNLPFYIIFILTIIKTLHYSLGLITEKYYVYLKNGVFHMYFNKTYLYNKSHRSTIMLDS